MRQHTALLLLVVGHAILTSTGCEQAEQTDAGTPADSVAAGSADSLSVSGFQTPESVLYDEAADVYLVSNINGAPTAKDDNGFISRVGPDGAVQTLTWIDGSAAAITLHAPKGMAIRGDTLFVADIDSVRAFSRTTGSALGARGVPGATFLNDLATGPDGVLYVSDSGLKPDFTSSGTDAVYRFDGARAVAVVRDTALHAPNGLAVSADGVVIVPFGGKTILRVPTRGGAITQLATLPGGQLDGVIRLSDGTLLVSSWETKTIYRVSPQGQAQAMVDNIESPADLGYDSKRNRVLIPLFNQNKVEIRRVQ